MIDINKSSLPNKRVALGKIAKINNSRATTIRQVRVVIFLKILASATLLQFVWACFPLYALAVKAPLSIGK